MRTLDLLAVAALVAGAACSWIRWLRVSQREHYRPGSALLFSWRWWTSSAASLAVAGVGAASLLASLVVPPMAGLVGVACVLGPVGLGLRGRTSPLAWTRRARTLAAASGLLIVALAVGAAFTPWPLALAALTVVVVDVVIDVCAWALAPLEDRYSSKWIERAQWRLQRVGPQVVAITGSYGKTSTKHHLAELLGGITSVVPTPRSFNNRAGLARAINEHLVDGTRVFIAEMGTYGPGEVRDLCSWCRPEVSVITAIGPVHLERFGTIEAIVQAKAEIAEGARVVVLNVDDERLAGLADRLRSAGAEVLPAGSRNPGATVRVASVSERWHVMVGGSEALVTSPIPGVHPTNLACALAAGLALGFEAAALVERIPKLAPVANRLTVATAPSGVMVVDDTYNSNPAGASAALELLGALPVDGRRVVVTPGMVELGTRQATENEAFAGAAARIAATVVVVGRTNLSALVRGSGAGGAEVVRVATRERAVEWVRGHLSAGDAVLYENDLPDHYP